MTARGSTTDSPNPVRNAWIERLLRLCDAPLAACVDGSVKAATAVRSRTDRAEYAPLEILGRIFAGTGPWIGGVDGTGSCEDAARSRLRDALLAALVAATSVDEDRRFNFSRGDQPLVDAALLAVGIFRAGPDVWNLLDERQQNGVLMALEEARRIRPWHNNWLLFSAVIEAFLAVKGRRYRPGSISHALRCFDTWYRGDGVYSDGVSLGIDYYNGGTIHPFLLTLVELDGGSSQFVPERMQQAIRKRARRHAETLERMIGADGAFPAIGRSITYRCGAFHLLAHLAWRGQLPETLSAARIRGCLDAAIAWTLDADHTLDEQGWLRVGLRGSQPDLADSYTSAGSAYFCLTAFLPLGLSPADAFWADPATEWSAVLLQRGLSPGPDKKAGKPTGLLGKVARGLQLGRRWHGVLHPTRRLRGNE